MPEPIVGKRWLTLTLALFFASSILLLVILPLRMSTEALSKEAMERVSDTSSTSAVAVERQMSAVTSVTSTYAHSLSADVVDVGSLRDANSAGRRKLEDLQRSNSDIQGVGIVSAAGKMLATQPYRQAAVDTDVKDREYFRAAMGSDAPYISDVLEVRGSTDSHAVVVAQAIKAPNSTATAAVLLTTIDVHSFQAWVDRLNASHGSALAIFDGSGSFIASPGLAGDIRKTDNEHVVGANRHNNWVGTETLDKVDQVSSYWSVAGTNWIVRATVSSDDAFASRTALMQRVLLTAAVLFFVVLVGIWMLRHVVRERSNAQQSLSQTEDRMREVIDTASEMFIELDSQGRITEWNNKAEEVLGWSRREVLGQPIMSIEGLVPEARYDILQLALDRLNDENELPWRSRFETLFFRRESGRQVQVEMSMWTTTVGGEVRLASLVQDITSRKRLDAEREAVVRQQNLLVEELRQADQSKSDFVSTVSHELRTPLTSIVGYLEMLRDGYGGNLNPQQDSMLEVVDRNSHRLLNLIEDLLMLSRIEAGTFRVDPVQVDVAPLVSGVVQALIPSSSEHELTLDVDVAADTGAVFGDPNQLERVLLNLLSNAIKFTPDGGKVSVHAYVQSEKVHIAVQDSGIGIAVEEQSRLFKKFFRSTDANSRAIQGTGLGLTIVKSIVESHGGEISLQSAPGVGTTVEILLPVATSTDLISAGEPSRSAK